MNNEVFARIFKKALNDNDAQIIRNESIAAYMALEQRAKELSAKSITREIPEEFYEEWVNLDYALEDIRKLNREKK